MPNYNAMVRAKITCMLMRSMSAPNAQSPTCTARHEDLPTAAGATNRYVRRAESRDVCEAECVGCSGVTPANPYQALCAAHLRAPAAVADGEALEVDLVCRVVHDLLRQRRAVHTRVRFAGDVEWVLRELREALEEALEDIVVVHGRRGVGGGAVVVVAVREAHARRRLEEDVGGRLLPAGLTVKELRDGGGVLRQGAVVGHEGAVLGEEADERGGAGPAVQPERDGVGLRVALHNAHMSRQSGRWPRAWLGGGRTSDSTNQ